MEKTVKDIGIYTDIFRTNQSDGKGNRLYHAKCKVCKKELYYPLKKIKSNNKQCRHTKEDLSQDFGIYINVHESENKTNDGHKLYNATCKVCGAIVEKTLSDIKRNNTICCHKSGRVGIDDEKINDMPIGWITESKLNQKIYDTWKAMISRTTEKYWKQYPSYTGTTVDGRWKILSNFVKDIKYLDGYDDWKNSTNRHMMLDKDTIIEGNKHYSKDTCRFITHAESNRDVNKRHPENLEKAREIFANSTSEPVRFTNIKTKEIIDFPSLKEGCRTLGLNVFNAWAVLSDQYPRRYTVKGWKISKI